MSPVAVSTGVVNLICLVITAVWLTSFIVAALIPTYNPPPGVQETMMAVVGVLFGGSGDARPAH